MTHTGGEPHRPSLHEQWPVNELRRVLVPLADWRLPVLDADLRAAIMTRADAALAARLPSLPATLYLEYTRTGALASYAQAQFARREMLRDLAIGEAVEGDDRFVDSLIDVVWAICEESSWAAPGHQIMQGAEPGLPDVDDPLVDLVAGETAATLGWTLRLTEPALRRTTPMIPQRIRAEVRRRVLEPLQTRDDFWWMGISDVSFGGQRGDMRIINNWNPWISSNWITAALFVEDDAERRARAIAKALLVLDQYLETLAPDGSCEEGTAYWSRAAGTLFDALELLSEATGGAIDIFDNPLIAEQARFVPRMHLAGPWFANFGDGSPRPEVPAGVLYRFGRRIGDTGVTALGAELVRAWCREGPPANEALSRTARTLEVVDEASTAPRLFARARFTWMPHDEVMVARDDENDSSGFALAAPGGHNGAPHGHNDIGSFIVLLDGSPVIIDPGVGTYTAQTFSAGRYDLWTMRSAYHNIPVIGGVEQAPGQQYAARDVRCSDTVDSAVLTLDLAHAYPGDANIERWQRAIALERHRGILITDEWQLREPLVVKLHIVLHDAPHVNADIGWLQYDRAAIAFEPRPARLALEPIELDDQALVANWDRNRLWRATAVYNEAVKGAARTTICRV